jgi:hypothetical protein
MLVLMLNFILDTLGSIACVAFLDLMTLLKARNNVAILYNNKENNNKKFI